MSAPLPTESTKRLLPWLVAVAFFMESLDTMILNTAVPTIADALQIAPLSMKAALTSYTISLAVFIPVSGWIADRYGTRWVFFTAIGIFSAGRRTAAKINGIVTKLPEGMPPAPTLATSVVSMIKIWSGMLSR